MGLWSPLMDEPASRARCEPYLPPWRRPRGCVSLGAFFVQRFDTLHSLHSSFKVELRNDSNRQIWLCAPRAPPPMRKKPLCKKALVVSNESLRSLAQMLQLTAGKHSPYRRMHSLVIT